MTYLFLTRGILQCNPNQGVSLEVKSDISVGKPFSLEKDKNNFVMTTVKLDKFLLCSIMKLTSKLSSLNDVHTWYEAFSNYKWYHIKARLFIEIIFTHFQPYHVVYIFPLENRKYTLFVSVCPTSNVGQ